MNFRGSTKRSKGRNSTAKFRGDLWYGQRPVMIPRWWGKRGGLQTGLPWLKMSEVNGSCVAEYYEMVSYGLQGQQSGWPENGSELHWRDQFLLWTADFFCQASRLSRMMFHACVRGMDESITDSLTGQSSSGGVSLNSQSSAWFKAFLCSCCCNVLLLIAVSYLVWYAIFRPPTDTICALDYRANLAMVQDNVTAVVQEYSLANATQDQIDCYLALYKKITLIWPTIQMILWPTNGRCNWVPTPKWPKLLRSAGKWWRPITSNSSMICWWQMGCGPTSTLNIFPKRIGRS